MFKIEKGLFCWNFILKVLNVIWKWIWEDLCDVSAETPFEKLSLWPNNLHILRDNGTFFVISWHVIITQTKNYFFDYSFESD